MSHRMGQPSLTGEQRFPVQRRYGTERELAEDCLADEVAVALVYNGLSHVVMMASPTDLEDFALGFSLSEGIIERPDQLYGVDIIEQPLGIELQIELASARFDRLKQQRRNLAGRTGCGLCGAESLVQAISAANPVAPALLPSVAAIETALQQLRAHQPLQASTGAVHGAALCAGSGDILLLREDVGRHNALDKLIGALHQAADSPSERAQHFVLISSRASYEMVHKCAAANLGNLVAVSAPTALAVEQAAQAGINLIGFARPGRHVIYTTAEKEHNHV